MRVRMTYPNHSDSPSLSPNDLRFDSDSKRVTRGITNKMNELTDLSPNDLSFTLKESVEKEKWAKI
jgi:hypothetical protein